MSTHTSDEPAFPIYGPVVGYQYAGLSIRDYFAAKWMQAHVSNPQTTNIAMEEMCAKAYRAADAMMKARSNP